MPSVSKPQAKLMAGVCNSPEFAKKVGIPQKVGCEFHKADVKSGILKDSIVDENGIEADGNVTMDLPLLIRILEYAREDLKSDNDLHTFVEKLMKCQGEQEVLDMSSFEKITTPEQTSESFGTARGRVHYSSRSLKIIDGAIHAIADKKTASERVDALKEYCKEHKVKYQQVYDAIAQETSDDYFTKDDVNEAKESTKIRKYVDDVFSQINNGNIGFVKDLRIVRVFAPGVEKDAQPLVYDITSMTDKLFRHRRISEEEAKGIVIKRLSATVSESILESFRKLI